MLVALVAGVVHAAAGGSVHLRYDRVISVRWLDCLKRLHSDSWVTVSPVTINLHSASMVQRATVHR